MGSKFRADGQADGYEEAHSRFWQFCERASFQEKICIHIYILYELYESLVVLTICL